MLSPRTRLCDLLGIEVPLLNAPMTPQAGGALARAVAEAGAFGMLGFDEDESDDEIAAQLALLAVPPRPRFGIGLAAWVLDRSPHLLATAIAAKPALISISFGDPAPYAKRVRDAGILLASQVQSRARAQQALDAGVDILVAQGTEAGGHTGAVGTLPLLQIVLDMTDRPVLAAGGIASGRGYAAVIAAGAAGAWVGTPFLLATESRSTPQARARILAADETQTVLTDVFDRAQRKPWPAEFRGRALRNAFESEWHDRAGEVDDAARARFAAAKAARDLDVAHVYAGESVGLLRAERPARDIVETLANDAAACLRAVEVVERV
jgi:nitronate monooxygenase